MDMIEPVKNKIGFGTAPFYGAGLAEERLGQVLSQKSRDEFLLSTKVGRLVEEEPEQKSGLFEYGHQKKVITDYFIELALDMEEAAPSISLSAPRTPCSSMSVRCSG